MYGWNVNVGAQHLANKAARASRKTLPVNATHGLMAGTRVASNLGWRPVEALAVGDKVLTFDNGVQQIVDMKRTMLWVDATSVSRGCWPVTIPSGALGNVNDVTLLPDQGVMLETEAAADPMGDPFAIVPAQALDGRCGIYRAVPQQPVELITLYFANEEVIYVDGGLMVHCPRNLGMVHDMAASAEALYSVVSLEEALEMLAETDDICDALVHSAGYVFGATETVLVA